MVGKIGLRKAPEVGECPSGSRGHLDVCLLSTPIAGILKVVEVVQTHWLAGGWLAGWLAAGWLVGWSVGWLVGLRIRSKNQRTLSKATNDGADEGYG